MAQHRPAEPPPAARSVRLQVLIAVAALSTSAVDAAPRSPSLRAHFQRLHPCPANGAPTGPCPGFEVDHRTALICGGRDELPNLQWLSIAEHRAKTRAEVQLCRSRVPSQRASNPPSWHFAIALHLASS